MRDDEPTRPADPTPEPTPRPDATPPPEGSGSRPVDPTATQQVPADHGPGGVEGPHGVEGPESTHGGPVAPYGGPGAPVVTDQVRPRLSRLPGRAGSITLIVLGGLLVLLAPVVWWVALMVQSMLLFGDGTVGGETPNGVGLELSSETRYAVDVVPTADLVQDPGAPVGAPAGPADDGAAQDAAGAGTDVVVMVATETTETTETDAPAGGRAAVRGDTGAGDVPATPAPGELLASMWVKAPPGTGEAEIYALAVHPGAQGRGLGGLLTEHALADARARGDSRMTLYVDGDNRAAVRVYERAGFGVDETHAQYTGRPARRLG